MGEAKRRREAEAARLAAMSVAERAALETSKGLADAGKLVEAGFAAFLMIEHPNWQEYSSIRLRELKLVWMSSAQHLFHSILCVLDEGEAITDLDMRRMNLVDKELTSFYHERKLAHTKSEGNA
jgi:hypothetical protein